jgi:uncharacterized protein (UPF0335 family)
MSISTEDMNELRRLATNTYEQEKSNQVNRIINGIMRLESELKTLRAENDRLSAAAAGK